MNAGNTTPQPGDAARSESADLQVLYRLVGEINSGQTLEDVVEITFKRMHDILPYYRIAIATYETDADELVVSAVRSDLPMRLQAGYAERVTGSSLAPLLRTQRIRILNDLEAYRASHPSSMSTEMMLGEGARSSLTLPLVLEGRPVGVIFFASRQADAYRPSHEALLQGIAGHIAAIVEKARLADALRRTHQRLESILRDSADGILVLDMENQVVNWNRGAERIFGYRQDEMEGKPFELCVPDDLRATGELAEIRRRVEESGFLTDYETRRLTKDGREIVINITATLLRDPEGVPFGRSSIVRDVTALKAMQEELLRSRSLAALGEMAASVAHEIRNPLAGISGAIQVLRDGFDPEDPRREVIGEVLENVSRLDQTVRDLLVFSKPWTPQRRLCPLLAVAQEAAGDLEGRPAYRGVRIACSGPDDIQASVDPTMVKEVLVNLIENAAYAMDWHGTVRCLVEQAEGNVLLRVCDHGAGVSPDIRSRLFTPFFTTKSTGSGLGLAICRKIMEGHDGSMTLESAVGRGTEVVLRFPRENSP